MSNRHCVVGLGELVWDLLPADNLPGGAPANFAFHVSQLGADGIVVSAVGDDPEGELLVEWIKDSGLDSSYIEVSPWATGTVAVSLNSAGQPDYVIHENVAWDHLSWTETLSALSQTADCVCVGSLAQRSELSRRTILQFLRATRPDCLRIFDVNLRQPHYDPAAIAETLALATVLKVNEAEWPIIARQSTVNSQWSIGMQELLARTNLQFIALTRGSRGSVLLSRNGMCVLEGQPIDVADTIGAGDAFAAGLAMGLLRGDPIDQIQKNAAAVADHVCTQSGATPTLPDSLLHRLRGPIRRASQWA